ncbi:MAG: formate dehydrogenase accessory sulfurtransferase FdhD [Bacteroidetes bacterium]|nr:MAG: formate dehydrogenase accessory sulfurtransferase FdhD [Bacteroidota bacterium]
MTERINPVGIKRVLGDNHSNENDLVVVEEPLEIRIGYGLEKQRQQTSITVTMRTPGDDEHLCLGFLFSEGIISSASQVLSAKYCQNAAEEDGGDNVMRVELSPDIDFNPNDHLRNFYANSSCGVCGKASIDHVKQTCQPISNAKYSISKKVILNLPNILEDTQDVFKHTGGLHACGLFDTTGKLLLHKEDVGRHNALDKLVGSLVISNQVPVEEKVLMLSGRISFELVQKAINAGIAIIVAVGAPSSLSIDLAKEYGVTLVGFLKAKGFNIYTGSERIID